MAGARADERRGGGRELRGKEKKKGNQRTIHRRIDFSNLIIMYFPNLKALKPIQIQILLF